jgi:carbamoyl-phosphate synthase large subunit
MTGGGAPGAAGIIQCLRKGNVELFVADASPDVIGRHLGDHFIQIPKGDDPAFTDTLLQKCIQNNIGVLLPLVTKELLPLAQHKKKFEQHGIKVLVASEQAVALSNDKGACYNHLLSSGLEMPAFFIVRTTEEFIHAAFELGHPGKPFCFKPSLSNGSRGFRIVSDSLDESDVLFHEKPYHTGITYAHALRILASKPFPQLLVTEFLPGTEYSVDCLADRGRPVLMVPRSREKMVNGISVQGSFVNDEDILDHCAAIIKALELHGNAGIQLRRSEKGEVRLLEVNPRVQGTIVAGLGVGVNLPWLSIKQEMGLPIKEDELKVAWGTRFSRHWTEIFYR